MQKVVKFRANSDKEFDEQLSDYLEDNSGETIVTFATLHNHGDEIVVVVFDDGE